MTIIVGDHSDAVTDKNKSPKKLKNDENGKKWPFLAKNWPLAPQKPKIPKNSFPWHPSMDKMQAFGA